MHRFWNDYTSPLIETLQPKSLLEIGAEFGWNTRPVLDFCRRTGAHLDVVDTVPLQSLRDTLAPYGEAEVTLHVAKSVDVVGQLGPYDFGPARRRSQLANGLRRAELAVRCRGSRRRPAAGDRGPRLRVALCAPGHVLQPR